MTKPSFLARSTWRQPRYLLVAMACVFGLALIPMGVRRAMEPTGFAPEQLLPGSFSVAQDLAWFRDHFGGDHSAMVSWEGCTLGNAESLALLAKKLESHTVEGVRWFDRATTGPQVLRELMQSRPSLTYADAVNRLEGAIIGPQQSDVMGRSQGNAGRTTCLVVDLSSAAMVDIRATQSALKAIPAIAAKECGIDPAKIHMVGAPVEGVAIGLEGRRSFFSLFAAAGCFSIALCYWRLRSVRLTAIVVGVGAASAGLCMALPSYARIVEFFWSGQTTAASGGLSTQLLAMPAAIYVLAISAALHFINYYGQALGSARRGNASAAAEEAVSMAWRPIVVGAMATAAAFIALTACDVISLPQFGSFAALGLLTSVALLFGIASVVLHRYPLDASRVTPRVANGRLSRLTQFAIGHSLPTLGISLLVLAVIGAGIMKLGAKVQSSDFVGGGSTIARDAAWFERHLGNIVPLEIVLTMPAERLRGAEEHAELDGQQYRLTMLEQLELMRDVSRRLDSCPQLGGALSAATFAPLATETALESLNRGGDYAKNKNFRDRLLSGDYVRLERNPSGARLTGRELWRLHARIARQTSSGEAIDMGQVLAEVRQAIDPVLWSYQQRDRIVQVLHEHGKQLDGAQVCVLFRAPNRATTPSAAAQEHALAELLRKSGTAAKGVSYFNLAAYDRPGRGNASSDDQFRRTALALLQQQDVVVLASAASDPTSHKIAGTGILVADVTGRPATAESRGVLFADDGGPRSIRAVYAGSAIVVEQAEQLLLGNLSHIFWIALGLVGVVLTLASMSVPAGLLTLIVSAAPLIALLGVAGWMGLELDFGIAMGIGLAFGFAVEGSLHLVNWYQRGLSESLDRPAAAERAMLQCKFAMVNIAIVAGLGLMPLLFSSLTPLREVAIVAAVSVAAALAASMTMLPAMLASPLGWFLAPAEVRQLDPLWPRIQALVAKWRQEVVEDDSELIPLPQPLKAPHFVDAPAVTPAPARRTVLTVSADERREIAEGPHAALQAKLQGMRRPRTGDSPTS